METIPILQSDSKATLENNVPTKQDEEESEYFENKQSVSNVSPDLKFKRHKNKHVQGFPTPVSYTHLDVYKRQVLYWDI